MRFSPIFPAVHFPLQLAADWKMSSNWWCDFVAGWIGGSAGIVVGHPADTVKVVQQVFAIKECLLALGVWCVWISTWPFKLGGQVYDPHITCQGLLLSHAIAQLNQAGGQRGILPTIQDLWRTEGIRRGFFKGMLYPIISNGAINSIFFGVYGSLLPRLQVAN